MADLRKAAGHGGEAVMWACDECGWLDVLPRAGTAPEHHCDPDDKLMYEISLS